MKEATPQNTGKGNIDSIPRLTPQHILESEEAIVWVRRWAKHLPYVREEMRIMRQRRRISMKTYGDHVVAYAILKPLTKRKHPGGFERRIWLVKRQDPYEQGCPVEAVDPRSIAAGQQSRPPRKPITKDERRALFQQEIEHFGKMLKLAKQDPAVMHPTLIGRPRRQLLAKLCKRLLADGPRSLSIAALSAVLKRSQNTVMMYRKQLSRENLIRLVKQSGSNQPAIFEWTGPAEL